MICVPIAATTNARAKEELARAAEAADLAELRLDYLQEPADLGFLLEGRRCPVIVTNRCVRQGGLSALPDVLRVGVLQEAVYLGAEYVDVEYNSIGHLRERLGAKVIVSYHNFEETPQDLYAIAQMLVGTGGDIVKIATYVNDITENVRICQLAAWLGVPKIVLGMGPKGLVSRVLAKKYGSLLTYAPLEKDCASAPGQLTVAEMKNLYNFEATNAKTRVFGVVGKPLAHSLSPHIHNAAFRHSGMDAVYVPFVVDEFEPFLKSVTCIDPEGFSVTIPHKEEAFRLSDEVDEVTRKIGAVNTIALRGGRVIGKNTDWEAALFAIKTALAEGESLSGKRCLVLGAGGAARAVVYGLLEEGAKVTITNRTASRANALAKESGCAAAPWEDRGRVAADIVVNSTALGMYPAVESTPYPKEAFRPGTVVFDAIYNPRRTRLLEEAAEAGCRTAEGLEMFIRQAVLQFEFWTGVRAPIDVMREAAIMAFDTLAETR